MSEAELKFLDDATFNSHVAKLISTKGELEGSGLTLQDIRNMIYTRRVKVNPNVEGAVEATKAKSQSTKRARVNGFGVDDILG